MFCSMAIHLLLCSLSRHVAGDEAAIGRQVIREQRAQRFVVIAPVAVQFACDAEPTHQLAARLSMRDDAALRVQSR